MVIDVKVYMHFHSRSDDIFFVEGLKVYPCSLNYCAKRFVSFIDLFLIVKIDIDKEYRTHRLID